MTRKPDLTEALRDALPTYRAPATLHEWARAHASDDALQPAPQSNSVARTGWLSHGVRRVLAAAVLFIAVAVGWGAHGVFGRLQAARSAPDTAVAELVDAHLRSLLVNHLTDVQSTDQHTVKPWFAGKTDFAPHVVDLAAQGFPLLGGRLDYVQGHSVATLVYGRRRHVISLFMWPSSPAEAGDARPFTMMYKGYATERWVDDGVTHWLVSDASPSDVDALRVAYTASR